MKKNDLSILNSLNGFLDDDLELEELNRRLEMLILKPTMVAAATCDDFWCDDNSCAHPDGESGPSSDSFGICDGDRNCDDFCDDHDVPGGSFGICDGQSVCDDFR